MKVLLIGARGQLGSDLVRALTDWTVVPVNHADLDVCDFAATRRKLEEVKADVVINTSAFHKVEECEDKPEKAFEVNAYAVRHLARVCNEVSSVLVHISTDYVFGAKVHTPLTENDPPNPLNVYGNSKLAGEYFVRQACPRHFVVRTCGLYGVAGASGKGGNFAELMIRLAKEGKPIKVVNDQVLTPTSTHDLAHKLKELIQTGAYGLYHLTSSGHCSWYEFAATIFQQLGLKPDLTPTSTVSFGAKVQRPSYSVLAHRALMKAGCSDMRPWPQALKAYLQAKGHLKSDAAMAA